MELKPKIIKKDGKNEYVVLPYKDYIKIQKALDDYEDLVDLRKAKSETVKEPTISFNKVMDEIKKRGKK